MIIVSANITDVFIVSATFSIGVNILILHDKFKFILWIVWFIPFDINWELTSVSILPCPF